MDYNPFLQLTGTRSYVAGAFPSFNEFGCEAWTELPATKPAEVGLMVVPAMYLGMPARAAGDAEIDPERSTIKTVVKGWTYTYKLSIK